MSIQESDFTTIGLGDMTKSNRNAWRDHDIPSATLQSHARQNIRKCKHMAATHCLTLSKVTNALIFRTIFFFLVPCCVIILPSKISFVIFLWNFSWYPLKINTARKGSIICLRSHDSIRYFKSSVVDLEGKKVCVECYLVELIFPDEQPMRGKSSEERKKDSEKLREGERNKEKEKRKTSIQCRLTGIGRASARGSSYVTSRESCPSPALS